MSNIPEILKNCALSTTTAGETYTEVIEPVTFSDTGQCRFTLKNEGILNHSSKLVLGVDTNASVARAFFPPNVGIGTLIKRATLSIGSKTICETDDWNHLQAMKSIFISNQNNKEREVFMSGRCINHEFCYETSSASSASNSNSSADSYTLSYGKYPDVTGQIQATKVKSFQLAANKPTFMIDMRDLFPFFRAGHQLPLYLMSESIHIDLTFEQDPFRMSITKNSASNVFGKSFPILRNECKILQDIIIYDGDVMQELRDSHKKISFTYSDYQLTKTSVTVEQAKNITRNLGGAGRLVTDVIWQLSDEGNASTLSDGSLLNKYKSITPTGTGTMTSNIKFNDTFVYPLDQTNFGKHFHNLMKSEGGIPYVSRDEYSNQGNGLAAGTLATFEVYDPSTSLGKSFFYNGVKIPGNDRVNSVGIQLIAQYTDLPALVGNGVLRAWIAVMKTVEIEDGITNVLYV
jgi:hypothetical protein